MPVKEIDKKVPKLNMMLRVIIVIPPDFVNYFSRIIISFPIGNYSRPLWIMLFLKTHERLTYRSALIYYLIPADSPSFLQ